MGDIVLGQQHLVEFYNCCVKAINNKDFIREVMVEAAKRANATVVADVFHEFNPHGISGVVVIAESHLAIHSWPEHGCVSIDLFTCSGQMNADRAIDYLFESFQAKECEVQVVARGRVPRLEVKAVL